LNRAFGDAHPKPSIAEMKQMPMPDESGHRVLNRAFGDAHPKPSIAEMKQMPMPDESEHSLVLNARGQRTPHKPHWISRHVHPLLLHGSTTPPPSPAYTPQANSPGASERAWELKRVQDGRTAIEEAKKNIAVEQNREEKAEFLRAERAHTLPHPSIHHHLPMAGALPGRFGRSVDSHNPSLVAMYHNSSPKGHYHGGGAYLPAARVPARGYPAGRGDHLQGLLAVVSTPWNKGPHQGRSGRSTSNLGLGSPQQWRHPQKMVQKARLSGSYFDEEAEVVRGSETAEAGEELVRSTDEAVESIHDADEWNERDEEPWEEGHMLQETGMMDEP